MIQYVLKCAEGHRFESWFQSAEAFDNLQRAGHLSCAVCGSNAVEKAVMAPRVTTRDAQPVEHHPAPEGGSEVATQLAQLRKHVEENADYVGTRFAQEARAMHLDETPERAIYGEANAAEAKALIEDGVPVAPLPFIPSRKTN